MNKNKMPIIYEYVCEQLEQKQKEKHQALKYNEAVNHLSCGLKISREVREQIIKEMIEEDLLRVEGKFQHRIIVLNK